MFFPEDRNLLEKTRKNPMSLEHRMIHVTDARVDIRLRKELEKVLYDELGSTEVDQPVCHDGDFFPMKKRILHSKII